MVCLIKRQTLNIQQAHVDTYICSSYRIFVYRSCHDNKTIALNAKELALSLAIMQVTDTLLFSWPTLKTRSKRATVKPPSARMQHAGTVQVKKKVFYYSLFGNYTQNNYCSELKHEIYLFLCFFVRLILIGIP